ncbi:MAG: metallophosphoesterase family protein [Ardenticatenaceae bacterium]|nr:metallophosphoesterase family protein [Ardenticatenaceae bacterium]
MRYAIVTDIHANYAALKAVDEEVRQLRTKAVEHKLLYWFLGDLIGYGPDPIGCLRWLKNSARINDRWVPGNHDEWLIRPSQVSSDAWGSLTKHKELLSRPEHAGLNEWFQNELETAVSDEVRTLVYETYEQGQAVFIHASVMKTLRRTTYLYPWKDYLLREEFDRLRTIVGEKHEPTVLFCGHTHYPMWVRQRNGRTWFESIRYFEPLPLGEGWMIINPGSVGQPRDGDTRAAYAIFDPENWTIEFRRVEYPVYESVAALRDQGYPESLAERLLSADGRADLQNYYAIYRRPQWDLEAIDPPNR